MVECEWRVVGGAEQSGGDLDQASPAISHDSPPDLRRRPPTPLALLLIVLIVLDVLLAQPRFHIAALERLEPLGE